MGARRRELLETRTEHEEKEQRLDQRGDDPHPVFGEADQLPPPDDLDRAQLAAKLRAGTLTVTTSCGVLSRNGSLPSGRRSPPHRRPSSASAILLPLCSPDSSASRIVVPV